MASTAGSRTLMGCQVFEKVGTGARSVIYRVQDPLNGQQYALKRVVRDAGTDYRFFEQTENEFDVSVGFSHPCLRRSFKLEKRRRWLRLKEMWLLMEYFPGRTLEQLPPDSLGTVVDIFTRTAEALASLHALGYAHADVKPNNILMNQDNGLKLIDFGQSCRLGTIKQRIQGTPDFIAPEQVRRLPIDARTDVFNLGATIYWALMGKPLPTMLPTTRPGRQVNLVSDLKMEIPHEARPEIPHTLSLLVINCVADSPKDRPANMNQVLKRLELVRLSEPEQAIRLHD